jgi:hypothetical protein
MHSKKRGLRHFTERGATKKACAECPFRRTSMKGYLGPWESPQALIQQAFSEGGFACHMTVGEGGNEYRYRVCAGSLVCANKSVKLYRDRNLQRLQSQAEDSGDIMGAREFCEYHKQ